VYDSTNCTDRPVVPVTMFFSLYSNIFKSPPVSLRYQKPCLATGHEVPGGEMRYSSTISLISALYPGGWLKPRSGLFTHFTGGCVGPRDSLEGYGKARPPGVRSPNSPGRNESPRKLRFRGCRSYDLSISIFTKLVSSQLIIQAYVDR